MIESLHIEDLGVIEEADLVLSPGLTALTGETGAGKTMVLTSLGLLLGQRAESTIVRAGAERALVEGVFTLDGDSPAIRRAAEAGAELEDDELIVSRTVPASGRSRAHLGGRAVPSAVLSEVGAHLVSVHGQGDQFRLRSTSAQRRALDCLGGREPAASPSAGGWFAFLTTPCQERPTWHDTISVPVRLFARVLTARPPEGRPRWRP